MPILEAACKKNELKIKFIVKIFSKEKQKLKKLRTEWTELKRKLLITIIFVLK